MTHNYTIGPWHAQHTTLDIVRGIISSEEVGAWAIAPVGAPQMVIAYVPSDYRHSEQKANVALLVAAPQLVLALERAVVALRSAGNAIVADACEAVVFQATGM